MPATPIRILHLDDNPLDAELVAMALSMEQETLPVAVSYVRTKEEYLAALERKDFDLILSDYRMGVYDGDQALVAAREHCPGIPFIIVTGELSEELVIETLKRGATDYVLKDRIFRLVPAIQRALIEAENEKKRLAAERSVRALAESEERYAAIFERSAFAFALVKMPEVRVVAANEAALRLFEFSKDEVIGRTTLELGIVDEAARDRLVQEFLSHGKVRDFETSRKTKAGALRQISLNVDWVTIGGESFVLVALRDVTERHHIEAALRQREAQLLEAQRVAHLGSWHWNRQTDGADWSEELYHIFGIDPATGVVPTFQKQKGLCYPPEEWERLNAAVQQTLATGTGYELDMQAIRHGARIWITARGEAVRDAVGGIIGLRGTAQDISERKRVEKELAEAHQRLGGILNSITEGYYALDNEWRFITANVTAEEHFGLPLAELLGRNLWELTGASNDSFVYQKFHEARVSGQPTHFEAQSHIRPGFWAEMHLYPRGEMLEVFYADISARKEAEGELRRANRNLERQNRELEAERLKWQRLIEGIADEVWACDVHGTVTMVNLATRKTMGLMDFEGRSLQETLKEIEVFHLDGSARPDQEAPLLRSLRGDVLRGEEIVRNSRTGTLRIRQYSSAPVGDAEGRIIGAVAVVRDVTEERQAAEKIQRLNEELEERVKERTAALERANKELEGFSYSVSHDLKAPLRLITGFAALMRRQAGSNLTTKQLEYLTTIQEQATRMDELIRALLEFSRITRKEPALIPVDTRKLVEEVVCEQRQLLGDEAGRRVQVKTADLPVVRADAILLRIVFTNLLSNAFKFTRTVNEPMIAVEAMRKDGSFHFRIADNGVGFPKGQTEKLFKVFQRLHGIGEFEGSGIGLANVRKIIERHGGQVCGEGEEGKGATFSFTLPVGGPMGDGE